MVTVPVKDGQAFGVDVRAARTSRAASRLKWAEGGSGGFGFEK
jgi:hypothetical protein